MTDHNHPWCIALKQNGYRLTPSRQAVVEILAASEKVLDAQMVFDQARKEHPGLGVMSVYRTLDKLEDLQLIQKVHQPDGCHAYIAAPQGHQHLLLCIGCGKAEFFEGDQLESLFSNIGIEKNYQIRDHWLQLFGLCPSCEAESR